ncbi:MAG TPA: 50S ribosomal protein L10 [Oligoflexia bacterium]|nr:50S ribosomal protein L10 [Oligoflexia bacterium]HMR25779.1 50S ribosomal protein L10 [Oligoflexia bacterium]
MPSQNRIRKEEQVALYKEKFSKSKAAVLSLCTGISVEDITEFRAKLRSENVEFKVLKNTIASRAVEGTSLEPLKEEFSGQTAVAFTESDPVVLAKIISDFAKAQETFSIKAGVLDGKLLDAKSVDALANIPSREVLLSRLAGSLQSPYAGMVYGLSGILRKFVYVLDAIRREKESKGE